MFRSCEIEKRYPGSAEFRQLATAAVVAFLLMAPCLIPGAANAEVLPEEAADLSAEELELKAAILENYRVLLLQEGLLLESRQEGAAAGAIEVTEDGVSVDGEQIELSGLEELVPVLHHFLD